MKHKKYTPEQIVKKLRESDRMVAGGKTVPEILTALGISEPTYYRWRRQYGSMNLDEAKALRELKSENARLKRIVADQALDLAILQEVSEGKW